MSTQELYALRWSNHQTHILQAFEDLRLNENLVDVTLVCDERSLRAHKVVLSACSPFFQRIFSENPCKHPVIVLKDFTGWEVQAIMDFMYKGEISVVPEQLPSLIKAAESLQVRGLAQQDSIGVEKTSTSVVNHQTSSASASPNDFERSFLPSGRYPTPGIALRTPVGRTSPFSPLSCPGYDQSPIRLPHMPRLSFPDAMMPRQECQSPITRRKQARPRRRSGEMCGAQDLSKPLSPPFVAEETAENLCMKKPKDDKPSRIEEETKNLSNSRVNTTPDDTRSPEMDLSMQTNPRDFRTSPPVNLPPNLNMKHDIENHSPLPFPPMTAVPALTMSSPHAKYLGLDSLNFLPPGFESCRNPVFDLSDPRLTPDSQLFVKKKSLIVPESTRISLLAPRNRPRKCPPHTIERRFFPYEFFGRGTNDLKQHTEELVVSTENQNIPQESSPTGNDTQESLESPPPLESPPSEINTHSLNRPLGIDTIGSDIKKLMDTLICSIRHEKVSQKSSPTRNDPPTVPTRHSPTYRKKKRLTSNELNALVGRPKGQHSAPRGGPPRSWTNDDLTEALSQVWHKRMTTSQASRTYGIPYNSLLMYVRGKYGKSLKLEKLKNKCEGNDDNSQANNVNNNNCKIDAEQIQQVSVPQVVDDHPQVPQPMFPFPHNFYHDFNPGFPIPVNLIHLLPQSEKNSEHYGQQPAPHEDACNADRNERVKKEMEEEHDLFRSPALPINDRRELIQQNGQE